ncbi:MAG: hypothetical protein BWY15_00662 [Firmicutes bacterium ADurb.Bin193]|nr:MAG: hypothetical protein BWY15_00662 [Firmicutes bacterium ADurb.Bin193]
MKFIFSKRVTKLCAAFICFFVAGVILLNILGYFLNLKYVSVLPSIAEADKYEIRSQLLISAISEVGVCRPEKAIEVWAEGLKTRSAALQYAVMTEALKDEYAMQLEKIFPNWVTGISSPWVSGYEIIKTEKTEDDGYIFYLVFNTETSAGPADSYKAIITVVKSNDFWQISQIYTDEGLYPYTGYESFIV